MRNGKGHSAGRRVLRGLFTALYGLPFAFAFDVGSSVKSCLPSRPELFWLVTAEFATYGFVMYVPAMAAGFLAGYFLRLKLSPMVIVLLLLAIGFAIGYTVADGGCLPL